MNAQKFNLKDTRVILESNFKKKLFSKLLKQYGRHKLSKELIISKSMLYHYKNNRVNNLTLFQFNKCLELINMDLDKAKPFIEGEFSQREKVLTLMKTGAKKRHKKLRSLRENIPTVEQISYNNHLNIKKWFDCYQRLLEVGPRKINNIKEEGNLLIINHTNFVKGKKKKFKLILPKLLKMDDEFCYFFGLWCGDRAGGGRIGVVNKDEQLNKFTNYYLKRLYQSPKIIILKSSKIKKLPKLNLEFDAIQEVKGMAGTYVPIVFAVNGVLKQFFFYLDKQLDEFLDIIPNKNAFFAGLFDAEGNVSLEDNCFRWSCKDKEKVKIYIKHLKKANLFRRYDGGNLVCYNKKDFSELIFPYLKHPLKINDTKLVCFYRGKLNKRFLNIINVVKENNGSDLKKLAKALKRVKIHAQIKVLERLGYVQSQGYPKRIYITQKGLAER